MKKVAMVLGAAVAATLAGCKDPDYAGRGVATPQNEAKSMETAPAKCTCPPGTVHSEPCKCGAPDCTCVVKKCTCPPGTKHAGLCPCGAPDCKCSATVHATMKPTAGRSADAAPAEETTVYVVRSGDYLAKISKRYNVTISSIRRLNPSIKGDVVRVGQKLLLPGRVNVEAAPAASAATGKKAAAAYTGPTKEYVVKSGDTLGAIAYGNGINIRQLKAMNSLSGDSLKVGQKLKIPATKPAPKTKPAAKQAAVPAAATAASAESAAAPAATEEPKAEESAPAAAAAAPVEAAESAAAPAADSAKASRTYVVKDGEDLTSVAIDFGVTVSVIRELNNLGEKDQLQPGQVIRLPADVQQQ